MASQTPPDPPPAPNPASLPPVTSDVPPEPSETRRPAWRAMFTAPSPLLVWQLLVALAIAAATGVAWRKLPDPVAGGGATSTPPIGRVPVTEDSGDAIVQAQRELAVAAINAYVARRRGGGGSRISYDELLKNVIVPLSEAGATVRVPLTIGKEMLDRIVEKDGWIENVAGYGGDLLKEYLKHVWAESCKSDTTDKPAPAGVPNITLTCAPTISLSPGTARRYVYRSHVTVPTTPPKPVKTACPLPTAPPRPGPPAGNR